MKRGKPTHRGIGSPERPLSGDDESESGRLPRTTQRGLSDSQPPKLVTMHGVAPPSDRPPPPTTAMEKRTLEYYTEPLSGLSSDSRRLDVKEDVTPADPGYAHALSIPAESGDRAQFRTAPGGGKNRVSGGRAAASAYVSPSTLAPGHGKDPTVGPVEVDEHVLKEARSYQTEPSLARKRASQLPPPSAVPPDTRSTSRARILLVLAATVLIAWIGGRWLARSTFSEVVARPHGLANDDASPEARLSGPVAPEEVASTSVPHLVGSSPAARPSSVEDSNEAPPAPAMPDPPPEKKPSLRNAAPLRPTSPHAEEATPPARPDPSPTQATQKQKRDLWLE